MELVRAPAVPPALAFVSGILAASRLAVAPGVGSAALLLALGSALGGPVGRCVAAAAGGALVAVVQSPRAPILEIDRAIEAVGRIDGEGRRFADGGGTVRLRAEAVRTSCGLEAGGAELLLDLKSGIDAPPSGARVRVRGTLARSAGFANERPVAPGPWRVRVKSSHFLAIERPPSRVDRAVTALRSAARALFERPGVAERPGIRVARSLLLGEAEALPERWRRALRRTGLAHLVAVSGFNVSLVAVLAGVAGAAWPRRARLGLAAVAVSLYVVLVGPAPSVLRAGAMGLLALGGLALERAPRALQTLAVAGIVLLAFEPALVDDPGFMLSVAATAGLLTLTPRWAARREGRWPRPAALAVAASLGAQAAALPWSVATFGEVAPLAPVWNLLATPWAAAAIVAGAGWALLAAAVPAAAAAAAPLLDPLAWPLEALTRLPPSPWISVACPGGLLVGVAAATPLVALGEGGRIARGGALALSLLLAAGHGKAPQPRFEAIFVDVGQGDAALLDDGEVSILVDGGGAPGRDLGGRILRPVLADRGRSRVALAVLSHADGDHCLGLVDLAAQVRFDEVWVPAGVETEPCVVELARLLRGAVTTVAAGDRRQVGSFSLEVHHPLESTMPRGDNAGSLVLSVAGGGRRILFPGDLDGVSERELARRTGSGLRADLLKVAHHGSARSSDPEFLGAVSPRLSVVSAGVRNAYGHPAQAALERLIARTPVVLRTDRDGAVRVRWRAGEPWTIDLPGSPRAVVAPR